MTYATQQDLVDRFGAQELARLTDKDLGETINASTVDRALADTDAEIDSYLSKRVATPLSPAPALVNAHACTIARYRLHGDMVTDRIRDAYKDARAWLEKAAKGEVSIDGLQVAEGAASADMPLVEGPERIFGRDDMKVF